MRLNHLSGKAWIKLSKSTWITQKLLAWSGRVLLQKDSAFLIQQKKRKKRKINRNQNMNYHSLNETRLKLIELFTQKDQVVFDPCIQEGDTMIAALFSERQFMGIAENKVQYRESINLIAYHHLTDQKYTLFDAENKPDSLEHINNESVDLVLTEIPRFDFKHYSKDTKDKNNYKNYLHELKKRIETYTQKLKPKGYLVLIVSDQRYQNQYYCCHADMIHLLSEANIALHGLINIIQDSQALKAFGYPTTYVPNIINQFAVIGRKR